LEGALSALPSFVVWEGFYRPPLTALNRWILNRGSFVKERGGELRGELPDGAWMAARR
jgi:hypothetical protein